MEFWISTPLQVSYESSADEVDAQLLLRDVYHPCSYHCSCFESVNCCSVQSVEPFCCRNCLIVLRNNELNRLFYLLSAHSFVFGTIIGATAKDFEIAWDDNTFIHRLLEYWIKQTLDYIWILLARPFVHPEPFSVQLWDEMDGWCEETHTGTLSTAYRSVLRSAIPNPAYWRTGHWFGCRYQLGLPINYLV